VVFIKVREGTNQAGAESMVEAFNALPQQVDSSILIQLTAGTNSILSLPFLDNFL
jgi:hypothetical protein